MKRVHAGLDVSRWQGKIDFQRVYDAGFSTIYIRSSYGNGLEDPYFQANYEMAKDARLRIGFYHYMTAETEAEAAAEADYFAGLTKEKAYYCRAAMHYECFFNHNRKKINEIGLAFLTRLEEHLGHKPVVYSSAYHAAELWEGSITSYPLWVAEYGASDAQSGRWGEWAGFQYTDQGSVPGVEGYVDRDYFTDAMFLPHEARPEEPAVPKPEYYTVQLGDTLWFIATQHGTTIRRLVKLNHIENPNMIFPGQRLRIR